MTKADDDQAKADFAARAQAASADTPMAYDGMSDEHAARVKAYDEHQEALRLGGGDTRVTPTPEDFKTPLIVWPLEQATVDVDIHKPGASFTVSNANPVPPPTGTATGVAPDEVSVGADNRASLQGAMSVEETPVVDVAAEATKTADEVATEKEA